VAAATDSSHAPVEFRRYLRRVLRDAPSARERAGAALALGMMRDRRGRSSLLAALRDVASAVRVASARSLAVVGDRSAAERLAALARVEADPAVRSALQSASARLRRPRVDPAPAGPLLQGVEVLQLQLSGSGARLLDVGLPDGRLLRVRTAETGELTLADLPKGAADIRIVE
jgi:hypothetical protein